MGMDPATAAALATAAGAVGSRIFAPQGQKLSSFQGAGDLDPHSTLSEAKAMLESVFGQAVNRANSPIDMSDAYVQPLPSFSGGGLPQPIGTTANWGQGKVAVNPHGGLDGTGAQITIDDPPFPSGPSPAPIAGGTGGNDPSNPIAAATAGTGDRMNISQSLMSAMDAAPAPANPTGSADTGGPMRRSLSASPMPGAPTNDVSGSGSGDTRALGAVSLLLHLAQGENQPGDTSSLLNRSKAAA